MSDLATMRGRYQRDEILAMVLSAGPQKFKPLMYIIPHNDQIDAILKPVPIEERANALSQEYRIFELPGSLFDILDIDDE
jgi:hypothetical protein